MANARIDKEWFRCARCGHKLARMVGKWDMTQKMLPAVEIKCSSCKEINYLMVGRKEVRDDRT